VLLQSDRSFFAEFSDPLAPFIPFLERQPPQPALGGTPPFIGRHDFDPVIVIYLLKNQWCFPFPHLTRGATQLFFVLFGFFIIRPLHWTLLLCGVCITRWVFLLSTFFSFLPSRRPTSSFSSRVSNFTFHCSGIFCY